VAHGGPVLFVGAPLGFVLSLLGIIQNKDRTAGIFGVLIAASSAALALLLFL
jgi:hypothetical protein